jgi:serine protease Do
MAAVRMMPRGSYRLMLWSATFALVLPVMGWTHELRSPTSATGLQDLLDVQKAVKSVLPVVRSALVALETRDGAASGVIVTPDGVILTAAHVTSEPGTKAKPGLRLKIILNDGRETMGTALGMDTATDAAMVQIDGKHNDWPFVDLNRNAAAAQPGQWCFALGHPGGYDAERGEVLRVGKVLKTTANSLQSDCVLMGGDSGGPLFSLHGDLIGIHSQIWEGRDQNVHVSLAPFFRSWEVMKESEIVRQWNQGSGGWLGVATRLGEAGQLEVDQVAPSSPAARAGMRSGDAIISFDGKPLRDRPHFSAMVSSRAAGDPVVLVVRNRAGDRILTMKLAQRPPD